MQWASWLVAIETTKKLLGCGGLAKPDNRADADAAHRQMCAADRFDLCKGMMSPKHYLLEWSRPETLGALPCKTVSARSQTELASARSRQTLILWQPQHMQ